MNWFVYAGTSYKIDLCKAVLQILKIDALMALFTENYPNTLPKYPNDSVEATINLKLMWFTIIRQFQLKSSTWKSFRQLRKYYGRRGSNVRRCRTFHNNGICRKKHQHLNANKRKLPMKLNNPNQNQKISHPTLFENFSSFRKPNISQQICIE